MSWFEELKEELRKLGLEFESEAEAIRVTLPSGTQIETLEKKDGEGISLCITAPLPGEGPEDPNYYIKALEEALKVALQIESKYRYEVDESLPGYPVLRIYMDFSSGDELKDKLIRSLRSLQ